MGATSPRTTDSEPHQNPPTPPARRPPTCCVAAPTCKVTRLLHPPQWRWVRATRTRRIEVRDLAQEGVLPWGENTWIWRGHSSRQPGRFIHITSKAPRTSRVDTVLRAMTPTPPMACWMRREKGLGILVRAEQGVLRGQVICPPGSIPTSMACSRNLEPMQAKIWPLPSLQCGSTLLSVKQRWPRRGCVVVAGG